MIIDDVITEGAAKREAIELIRGCGAEAAGILIAMDRQERGKGEASAVQELQAQFGVPVVAIATLDDLMTFIGGREELQAHAPRVAAYRAQYGVAAGAGGAARQQ